MTTNERPCGSVMRMASCIHSPTAFEKHSSRLARKVHEERVNLIAASRSTPCASSERRTESEPN